MEIRQEAIRCVDDIRRQTLVSKLALDKLGLVTFDNSELFTMARLGLVRTPLVASTAAQAEVQV